jgi:Flp pilus assembly protein TadD
MPAKSPPQLLSLRLLIPLVVVWALNPYPISTVVITSLQAARQAETAHDPLSAGVHLRRAVAVEPWRTDLWEPAGLQALEGGDPKQAIHDLEMANSQGILTPEGLLNLGDAYRQIDEADKAQRSWEALEARIGLTPELAHRLLEAALVQGDNAAALRLANRWSGWRKEDAALLLYFGLRLLATQPAESAPWLDAAQTLDPLQSAAVRAAQKGQSLAEGAASPAYRALQVGRSLGAAGYWSLAKDSFDLATRLEPGYAEAWAFLSEAEQQVGEDGGPALEQAARLDPSSDLVLALLGMDARRLGQLDLAAGYFTALHTRQPHNPVWMVELGSTQALQGELYIALDTYKLAAQTDSENPLYWRVLAEYCLRYLVETDATGLPAARQAAALDPYDPLNQDVLGQALALSGDQTSAGRAYLKALELDPNLAAAHLHLGQVYLVQGKNEDARQELNQALTLGAGTPAAAQAAAILDKYLAGSP